MTFQTCKRPGRFTIAAFALVLCATSWALAEFKFVRTSRINSGIGGAEANAGSGAPTQAANGRFVVFRSIATNLTQNATNGLEQVYIRDLSSGALTLASQTNAQIQGDGNSTFPSISPIAPSGFFAVAFESSATNMGTLAGLDGTFKNIFVHIPAQTNTEIVSIGAGGTIPDGDSTSASITVIPEPNRLIVSFISTATNLIEGETNAKANVYLATAEVQGSDDFSVRETLSLKRVSKREADGAEPNADSSDPRVSWDGRFIVYASAGAGIVTGVGNASKQIYLYDINTGQTSLLSKNELGEPADGDCSGPVVSYSGRYVAFITEAKNLTNDNAAALPIVARLDRESGRIERVNSSQEGLAGNGGALDLSISADGRFVSFTDASDNLVDNDTNGIQDIFVKDLDTRAIVRTNVGANQVEANGTSNRGVLAGNGYNSLDANVSYFSNADNLVSGDTAGNGDIFSIGLSLSPQTLFTDTILEVPPDISPDVDQATVQLQIFDGAEIPEASILGEHVAAAGNVRIRYDIRLQNESKRRDSRRRIAKRNRVTFKKLKPGTYRSTYRTVIRQGKQVVSRSPFSPANRFQIP